MLTMVSLLSFAVLLTLAAIGFATVVTWVVDRLSSHLDEVTRTSLDIDDQP